MRSGDNRNGFFTLIEPMFWVSKKAGSADAGTSLYGFPRLCFWRLARRSVGRRPTSMKEKDMSGPLIGLAVAAYCVMVGVNIRDEMRARRKRKKVR